GGPPAAAALLHQHQHPARSRRPPHGRYLRRRGAPRMIDQIRKDLEPVIQQLLSKRPEFRLVSIEPIPEGHSGFTYFVDVKDNDGPTRYVLRLPPPGVRIAGPADVIRQGRIMSALHLSGLPTPAISLMSEEPVVDGRPFILMERVAGDRIEATAQREDA